MANGNIQKARENLNQVLNTLNSLVVGKEEENRLLLLTLVARENLAMIGPPGTAKTYRLDLLAKLLKARFFSYLMTRFTSDIELFGAFDIPALTQRGELKRLNAPMLEADIVFLDEAFKASSAILNSLLSILQERVYRDPITGQAKQVNVWSVFVASNEVPSDEELQALYDRFSVRVFERYLDDDALILHALEARWLNNATTTAVASMDDVKTLNTYAHQILSSVIKSLDKRFIDVYHSTAIAFIKSLRSKGIIVSDRTIIEKLPKLVASRAALEGLTVEVITNGIIDILPHLGRDANEAEEIKKAIMESLGEVAELHNKLSQVKALTKAGKLDDAMKLCEDVMAFDVQRLASKPWLKSRVEIILREAKMLYDKLQQIKSTLEAMAQ